MKKTLLEYVDRFMTILLAVFTCLGMFLMGVFFRNMLFDTPVSLAGMAAIFLGSIIVTYLAWGLFWTVKYDLSDIMAEEEKREKELQEAIKKREQREQEKKGMK